MALANQATTLPEAVHAPLQFLVPDAEKPKIYIGTPKDGIPQRTGEFQWQTVPIIDGRSSTGSLSLDREGFELHPHTSVMKDFYNDDEIHAVHYPEIEQLLKQLTGATKVHIFDHTVRVESDHKRDEQGVRAPVRIVHNDYTTKSGPQRVRDLLPADEADIFLNNHFSEINVWRSIATTPAQTTPIAVADAQSIDRKDFIASDLVYDDRVGEIYQIAFNPDQRWYYFSDMQRDEILLLKCFDSATDGRAQFTGHSAFKNPLAAADAPPRESIEVRTLLSFAPEFA